MPSYNVYYSKSVRRNFMKMMPYSYSFIKVYFINPYITTVFTNFNMFDIGLSHIVSRKFTDITIAFVDSQRKQSHSPWGHS